MDGLSCNDLQILLKVPIPPLIIDARHEADYNVAAGVIPGAIHRDPEAAAAWAPELDLARPIAVYGAKGENASKGAAKTLCDLGLPARYLKGGFEGWAAAGGAIAAKREKPSLWVTRERPKIDRIACPWLIRRFIDPDARFLYVPPAEVIKTAGETGATPYDIPGVILTHRGERCSFDAFVEDFSLAQPALLRLADMVRGADTDRMELAPQAAGLFAISLGLSINVPDDHAMLRYGLVVYDALYAWIVSAQGETHNWPPAMPREAAS